MRRRVEFGLNNMTGGRIRSIRESKNIDQGTLLARVQLLGVDMSQSKLSRIEGQEIRVFDRDLYAIAKALDVNISDLFPEDSDKTDDLPLNKDINSEQQKC